MNLYCTFKIDDEVYGINVSTIQEIIQVPKFTPIPRAKKYIKGVFSLRGQIVTNLCLNSLFEKENPKDLNHCLVIQKSPDPISINVNEILDIIEIDQNEIETAPDAIPENIKPYIFGIKKEKDYLITLIDIDQINV